MLHIKQNPRSILKLTKKPQHRPQRAFSSTAIATDNTTTTNLEGDNVSAQFHRVHTKINPTAIPVVTAATAETDKQFNKHMTKLIEEGRYRVFFDIERTAGQFPKAINHSNVSTTTKDSQTPLENTKQQVTVCVIMII
eukprot:UN04380